MHAITNFQATKGNGWRALAVVALTAFASAGCSADAGGGTEETLGEENLPIGGGTQDPTNAMNQTVRITSTGLCSGVLVTNQWVLTANHCVAYDTSPSNVAVTMGWQTASQQQSVVAQGGIVRFPGNGPSDPNQHEDALLLKLATPFSVNGSTAGFARSQWPAPSSTLNDPGRIIRQIGWGGAGTFQTYADLDPLSVTLNRMINGIPVGDTVEFNCTGGLPCPVPGDSGGGGFAAINGTTFQTDIFAGFLNGQTYALATSTPTVRQWLDKQLYTDGGNIFNESTSNGGIGVSSRGANQLDLFWVDTSGNLEWKWYSSGWGGTSSLGKPSGVTLTGRPASVSWSSSRINVFVTATNGSLWQRYYTGGAWVPGWFTVASSGVASSPAVSSWGPNRLDLFVRGGDSALHHTWYDSGWGFWESLGGVIASAPAAVSWGFGRIDVVARTSDSAVWHKWFSGSWQAWGPLGGSIVGDPGISSWGPGRLNVFGRNAAGYLSHRWFEGWWLDTWTNMFIPHPDCGASAVSWGPGRVDVFTCNGGSIWQTFFPRP